VSIVPTVDTDGRLALRQLWYGAYIGDDSSKRAATRSGRQRHNGARAAPGRPVWCFSVRARCFIEKREGARRSGSMRKLARGTASSLLCMVYAAQALTTVSNGVGMSCTRRGKRAA
jgi:hypothetical protein